VLATPVTLTLPVGRVVAHRWTDDFVKTASTVDVVLRTPQRVTADAKAKIAGHEHHRIRGGPFAGHWVPTLGSLGLRAGFPLPSCTVADQATRHPAYGDWHRTLVDLTYMVPGGYAPPDLVKATDAGVDYDRQYGIPLIRRVVLADLTAMAAAARSARVHLRVNSAYRSYDTQLAELLGEPAWFQSAVRSKGYDEALLYTNRAGHSEHQLGTTLDIEPYVFPGAHAWLTKHAWSYGFLLSYPEGRNGKHCYGTEIWHYRYYGRETAAEIRASGLSPREWLWYVEHQ
jgi:D-alanyl-D-alanine carboxypeptidase